MYWGRKEKFMSRRLYIGNLAYNLNEVQINDFFNQVGVVSTINLVTDKQSGRGKGFGFVEMSTDQQACQAIKKLNGRILAEREIVVTEAKPEKKRKNDTGDAGLLSRFLSRITL